MVLDPAQLMIRFVIGLLADLLPSISPCHPPSLLPHLINQACITSGIAALSAETRKHKANDPKCSEQGCVCVPLAVETYGNWGKEARDTFSRLATQLAIGSPNSKSSCVYEIYSRLNLTLTRSIVRAIMVRTLSYLNLFYLYSMLMHYQIIINLVLSQ